MTVLGTRPEIIRLSAVIPILDRHADHIVVHTGQNFDDRLNGLFFRELAIRSPDAYLNVNAVSFGDQIGKILAGAETLMLEHRPDRVLILGDTNSGLVAIVARRLGIPVYHMEAGNRCYDDRVPEEVNRRVIDHSSSVLLPYTNRSRENLLREGIEGHRVHVTGNPIKQVLDAYADRIEASTILTDLGTAARRYFLVTVHRAENVDREDRLRSVIEALRRLTDHYGIPAICSLHPRTRSKIEKYGVDTKSSLLKFVEPFGLFDFVKLERSAFCVLSDSGTVQEETCILGTPNVTIREVTERPEILECGASMLSGTDAADVMKAVAFVTTSNGEWTPPPEYRVTNVAETVARIVLGFRPPDASEFEWKSGSRV